MRMECKLSRAFIIALTVFGTLLGAPSRSDACTATSQHETAVAKLEEAGKKPVRLRCANTSLYDTAAKVQGCNTCQQRVNHWIDEAKKAGAAAVTADRAAICAGTTGANGIAAAAARAQAALTTGVGGVAGVTGTATATRETTSRAFASATKKCADEIDENCKFLAAVDRPPPQKVMEACLNAERNANNLANTQKKDGLGLGDLGKAMDLATKGLGLAAAGMQLANAANQQGAGDPNSQMSGLGATAPTPSSINGASASGPESSSLGTGKDAPTAPGVGIGSLNGQTVAASRTAAGVDGFTTGASGSYGAYGSGSSNLGANGAGPAVATAGGSGSGSGGAGSSDSTGSSRPRGGSGAGEAGGASSGSSGYEVSGGGGGKPMLGMKGSKADLDEITGGAVDPAFGDLGGRDPASVGEEQAVDVAEADTESIFERVRTKYANLKVKGRF